MLRLLHLLAAGKAWQIALIFIVTCFLVFSGLILISDNFGCNYVSVHNLPLFFNQVLRLHLDYYDTSQVTRNVASESETAQRTGLISLPTGIFAGAVVLTSIGVLVYLKRNKI